MILILPRWGWILPTFIFYLLFALDDLDFPRWGCIVPFIFHFYSFSFFRQLLLCFFPISVCRWSFSFSPPPGNLVFRSYGRRQLYCDAEVPTLSIRKLF